MSTDKIIRSFNAGEWSEHLDGRDDLEKFFSACRVMCNMIPLPFGDATRRPGTYYVCQVKDSTKKVRLIPFQYSNEQAYILAYGDNYIRFFKDRGQIVSRSGSEILGALSGNTVGHWVMNDDAASKVVLDAITTPGQDGVSQRNTNLLTSTGAVDAALLFGGVLDYITIPDAAAYDFADAFSMAIWVNTSEEAPDSVRHILYRYDTTTADGYRISINTDGKFEFGVTVADTETVVTSNDAVGKNTWYFVSVTRSAAGLMKMYINTVLQEETDTQAGEISTASGDIVLGISTEREALGPLDANCTALYLMNDNAASTTVIDTKSANNGVAQQNTEDIHTNGVINGALTLNGSTDFVTVADNAALDFAGALSIVVWVKPVINGLSGFIVSRWGGETGQWDGYHVFKTASDHFGFSVEVNSGIGVGILSNAPATGDWQLIVCTRDASGHMKLYVDGVLQNETNTNAGAISCSVTLYIGIRSTSTQHFEGIIDNLVMFDIELSQANVDTFYAKGKKFSGIQDNLMLFDKELSQSEINGLYSETPYEISTEYTEADLFGIQKIQSADVLYNVHGSYKTKKLLRYAHADWAIEDIVFDEPPFLAENISDITITPSAMVGNINLAASAPVFTAGHVGSSWLIKHNRTDNTIEKTLTTDDSGYAATGIGEILVDVKGTWKLHIAGGWTGTVVLERAYDEQLILVLDDAPTAAWLAGDVLSGASATCVIVAVIDTTHYYIKHLSGSFVDGETITGNRAGSRDCAATYPRYEGWHTLGSYQSAQDQNFNIPGEELIGSAYLRVRRTVDSAGNDPVVTLSCERYYHYGIVKILSYISELLVSAQVIRVLGGTDATKLWSEGAWSNERGYPVSCGFYEDRLWLAGTSFRPLDIWGSKTSDYENMVIGPLDDDSVKFTINATQQNIVRWMVGQDVLLIGTAGAEWKLGSPDPTDAISPANPINPKIQTTYGSRGIQAILLANSIMFVDDKGRRVRGARYVFEKGEAGGYDAQDFTLLAEHITESGIVDMAYQQNPYPILWVVRDDGGLVGMVFEPGEKIWGWFRCEIDGDVESVAVIPGVDEDEVWIVVKRIIDGSTVRYIEYFKPRDWGSDQADCFFVDSGLTFDGGEAVSITGITKADPAVVTVSAWPTDGDGINLADGDLVRIRGVMGMSQVNTKVYAVSNPDTSALTFELRDKTDSVDVVSTAFTTPATTVTGDLAEKSDVVNNVSAADIAKLAFATGISGSGIPDDTVIKAIGTDNFTMSNKAIETNAAVTVTGYGTVEKVAASFSGLGHLEGKTVSILGDGAAHADKIVSSAAITTDAYFNKAHIGLGYKSKLMPMKLEFPGASTRGKKKRIHQVIFSFYKTLGAKFGTKEGNPVETIPFRKISDPMGSPPPLFTGTKQQTFQGGYELGGDIYVEQDQPLPLTVRSITARLEVYG